MHCASLGEYEMGKPILIALKRKYPEHRMILSFFSPSGFNMPVSFFHADAVFPLALDGPRAAKEWINAIHPEMAVFVKQELWYHYLMVLNRKNIPVYLVSGTISSVLLKWPLYHRWYVMLLRRFTYLFLQNDKDLRLAAHHKLKNAVPGGNARVDSVVQNRQTEWKNELVSSFVAHHPVLFFGSAWPADIPYLKQFLSNPCFKHWKVIWAPHDISNKQIALIMGAVDKASVQLFSEENQQAENKKILVLNTLGLLKYAYRFANLTYVGGGFGKGIHNLLEPIVYRCPVIFGPNYKAFPEAHYLIENGGGFSIKNLHQWQSILEKLKNPQIRQHCGWLASSYIDKHMGTKDKILPLMNIATVKNG
jgi:3-deoxy-D-manno-octulosonic-acid transferase